jgi:hypothetical protein
MNMTRASQHTLAWRFQVWASFVIAVLVTSIGIAYLPVPMWSKAFLGMGLLFTIGSCFSLAKTVRDDHEAGSGPEARASHPFRTPAA